MKEGDRVCRCAPYSKDFEIATVFKVYKNGNFILEKGGKQIRANGFLVGRERGRMTGFWELMSDEKHAELIEDRAARNRVRMFCTAVEQLRNAVRDRSSVSDDHLAHIEQLVREIVR